jgi:hypothetical protein
MDLHNPVVIGRLIYLRDTTEGFLEIDFHDPAIIAQLERENQEIVNARNVQLGNVQGTDIWNI